MRAWKILIRKGRFELLYLFERWLNPHRFVKSSFQLLSFINNIIQYMSQNVEILGLKRLLHYVHTLHRTIINFVSIHYLYYLCTHNTICVHAQILFVVSAGGSRYQHQPIPSFIKFPIYLLNFQNSRMIQGFSRL